MLIAMLSAGPAAGQSGEADVVTTILSAYAWTSPAKRPNKKNAAAQFHSKDGYLDRLTNSVHHKENPRFIFTR
jgi:hypothetical protein